MPDYDEINRRLRAERPDPPAAGSPEWRQARDAKAYADLHECERLAIEIHRIWESQHFPGGTWLDVEGTKKLALNIPDWYSSPDSYSKSHLYIMIDGRLVWYIKTERGTRIEGIPNPPPEITFMTFRQYIDQESSSLTATDGIAARNLQLLQKKLVAMR
jgi:hypothetical protein